MKADWNVPAAAILLLAFSIPAGAEEWTRFRGPNGTGIAQAKSIPTQWKEKDVNWKVRLPGVGHSSPVVWQDKIFLMSAEDTPGRLYVVGLKAGDGSVLWKREFPFTPFQKHKFNSFASPTPAVDENQVYVCWSTPDRYRFMALDHQGNTVWERDLGTFKSQHGSGASPMRYKDLVILGNEQDGESFLIAVEAKTGQTRWQTPRRSASTAYGTACVYQPEGQAPVLLFNSEAHGISAVDPDTGKLLWEYAKAFDKRSVSSPVVASGLIIGSCGSGGGGNYVVAVRPGNPAEGKPPQLAYEVRKSAPYVPTSISVGDLLFLWSDGGIVTCLDAPSGEIHWQERVGGNFFGSPICVDGRLFAVSTSGEVVVVRASKTFEVLARNPLEEMAHTTPAVANGRMYIRTVSHLYSVGGKATEVSLK